uniref:Uncharacterized protein n=1 Tax=Klebsiella pneumoniae TaxID=573 RepID=A0A223LMG5_KLEPN|nr:Hypothetical protein [Klebsiella pneumoniae]
MRDLAIIFPLRRCARRELTRIKFAQLLQHLVSIESVHTAA